MILFFLRKFYLNMSRIPSSTECANTLQKLIYFFLNFQEFYLQTTSLKRLTLTIYNRKGGKCV